MGVPKFYRWISERYPCLSQVIREHQIPEFDNMYLDMNGIIHPCSHPNDEDAHFRITEAEIFQNIFNYIEVLFRLIKPQKVFFMAVDGVAPRAKMNQQRSRRFRTAMESEKLRKDAIAKGETLPEEDKFDSNSITPGTEFMCKLQEQLKYFINMKISKDPAWQKVQVILSGHNVPGEGEHKIMDYIRWTKQQDNYNPDTRHCLYGLDADLMFLGLGTHELHFSLLREEVKFGKAAQKKISNAEEQKFHLLHISLFREYIDAEFQCLKETLGELYDLERIIDDFILLGFLVGNDFIPHLPEFHIHANTLPLLWSTYKKVRPTISGYLHDNGLLNLERFGKYLEVLSAVDFERFEVQYADLKWLAGKQQDAGQTRQERITEMNELKKKFGDMMLMDSDDEIDEGEEEEFQGSTDNNDEIEEAAMLLNEFRATKNLYYINKFHMSQDDVDEFIKTIGFKYIEGIKWILEYYFRGVPSWSWYYPYHYAPYLSDITSVSKMEIKLNLDVPFKPFQQLMAVLPAGSSKLLPLPLQELYKANSPVKDFYPEAFDTDLNGKKQEWEAVVLIPFIEEKRLLDAMLAPLKQLTPDEVKRNNHGKCVMCHFDINVKDSYHSNMPKTFPDIRTSYTRMTYGEADCFRTPPEKLISKNPDPYTDPFTMGFPTTRHLVHTRTFEGAGCKVFQHASRDQNCILNIDPKPEVLIEDYAKLLGTSVHVDFPHLVEAQVVGVYNESTEYIYDDNCVVKKPADKNKKDSFKHVKSRECISLRSRFGIEVGDVTCMLRVRKARGRTPQVEPSGAVKFVTHWHLEDSWVPGQLVLPNLPMPVPMQRKLRNLQIEDIFPPEKKVFLMNNPGYGSIGKVTEIVENKVRLNVSLIQEPYFDELRDAIKDDCNNWYTVKEACSRLSISPFLLSKITSTFQVDMPNKNGKASSRINIGLNVKYANRNLIAPGYARKIHNGVWQFSEALVDIVSQYKKTFPELFRELQNHIQKDAVKVDEICEKFGPEFDYREYIDKVRKYLKNLPLKNVQLVGVGSELLSGSHVNTLVAQLLTHQKHLKPISELDLKVKPKALFNPSFQNGVLPPDERADFELCDRVVNVCPCHSVPFGAKGTVIGIQKTQDQKTDNAKYEVLFDHAIIGGRSIGEQENRLYTMMPFSLINISFGMRIIKLNYKLTRSKWPRNDTPDHYKQKNIFQNTFRTFQHSQKEEGIRREQDRRYNNRAISRYESRSDEGSVDCHHRTREGFRRYPNSRTGPPPPPLPHYPGTRRPYGPPIITTGYQPYNFGMMHYGRSPRQTIPQMGPPSPGHYAGYDPYTMGQYGPAQTPSTGTMGVILPSFTPQQAVQSVPQSPGTNPGLSAPHVVPHQASPSGEEDPPLQHDNNADKRQKRVNKSSSSEGSNNMGAGLDPKQYYEGPTPPPCMPVLDPYLMRGQVSYFPFQYPAVPPFQSVGGMMPLPGPGMVPQPAPPTVMPQPGYTQILGPDGTIMTVPTEPTDIGYYTTYY